MSIFNADREKIPAFEFDGIYLFKQYFDQDDASEVLKSYYNEDKYRFEVLEYDLDNICEFIYEYSHDLLVEEDLRSHCVVKQKNSNYSDVLKNSILMKRHSGHIILLMKDQLSVEQAIEHGVTPLPEADIHA